jgi:hypothetical protein
MRGNSGCVSAATVMAKSVRVSSEKSLRGLLMEVGHLSKWTVGEREVALGWCSGG